MHASKSPPNVLTVGQLNAQIRDTLLRQFRSVWVAGEVSGLSRPRSGHCYFSLKDDNGCINAVIWRSEAPLDWELKDGMAVLCRGEIDVYGPRGIYQLIVRQVEVQGEGALQQALRHLRDKLQREGLFRPERKRPLPAFPRRLAVVTSPSGAALQDFLEVVRRRWRGVQIIVVPTRVQGDDAAPEIVTAIRTACQLKPLVDAIVVTRGGGSLEDLWAFNDERVVRAIHAAPVPVVSAVGHEIDVTLADLVADLRALTPSEAGERLVPDGAEVERRLHTYWRRMLSLLRARQQHVRSQVAALARHPILQDPSSMLRQRERRLDELQQRATRSIRYELDRRRAELTALSARLEALSPLHVLSRGYSLTQQADGTVLSSASDVAPGDEIHVRLAHGGLSASVRTVEFEEN